MCLAKKREWLFHLLDTKTTVLLRGKRLGIGIEENLPAERRSLCWLSIFHGKLLLIRPAGFIEYDYHSQPPNSDYAESLIILSCCEDRTGTAF
jgi:hypothetical protein